MKFGISYAYWGKMDNSWNCDYLTMTNKIADCGFDVFEISAAHLYEMDDEKILTLKKKGLDRNIQFIVNSGPTRDNDFASSDPEIRNHALLWYKSLLHKMETLGSKDLIGAIYSFWPSDFQNIDKQAAWANSLDGLKKLSKTAELLDITCSLEVLNRNETYILNDCAEAIQYVKCLNSDHMKILLDTYHMNIEENNMYDAIRKAGGLLGHLHVAENNRILPGFNNSIHWPLIGQALRDIHYQRTVVIESFVLQGGQIGNDVRVWRDLSNHASSEQLEQNLLQSLQFLKANFLINQ